MTKKKKQTEKGKKQTEKEKKQPEKKKKQPKKKKEKEPRKEPLHGGGGPPPPRMIPMSQAKTVSVPKTEKHKKSTNKVEKVI